eukprot:XP_024463796.1 uncharacterized protein LOC112328603 [Populus trichocarpa]
MCFSYYRCLNVMLSFSAKKEFHVGCLRESGLCDLEEIPEDNWFCCQDCNNIYVALRNSVSTGVQKIPASLLNIINRKHVEKGLLVDEAAYDVQWQILTGKSRSREDLSLLFGGCCNFSSEFLCAFLDVCFLFPLTQAAIMQRTV